MFDCLNIPVWSRIVFLPGGGSSGSEFRERTGPNPGSEFEFGVRRKDLAQPWFGRFGVWRKERAKPWFGRFRVRRKEWAEPWFGMFGVQKKDRAEPWFGRFRVWRKNLGRTLIWSLGSKFGENRRKKRKGSFSELRTCRIRVIPVLSPNSELNLQTPGLNTILDHLEKYKAIDIINFVFA